MDCIICIAKTKALISCAVTAQLICVFVFAYAKNPVFSYRGPYNKTGLYRGIFHFSSENLHFLHWLISLYIA